MGNSNVSHGCDNVSPTDGEWFFNYSQTGDVVQVRERARKQLRIQGALAAAIQAGLPEWVEVNDKEMRGVFKAIPAREDVLPDVNENLVVELYSK